MDMSPDRRLVVEYLHHTGRHKDVLTSEQAWEVYCLGDGYGLLPPEALREINEGWDWSHIRDSSPEGFARMAGWLREHGFGLEGPESAPPVP